MMQTRPRNLIIFAFALLVIQAAMLTKNPFSPFYLLGLFLGVYIAIFRLKWVVALLLLSMTNVFGVFSHMKLPPVRTPLGTFHLTDVIFLLLTSRLIFGFLKGNLSRGKSVLSLPIFLLLILILVQILRAYFLMHEDIHYIMRVARPFVYYALFFAFLYQINDENKMNFIINAVVFIGFVSAIVGIIQVIFGFTLSGSKIEVTVYGYDRTYQPNILFTIFGFFILLSKNMNEQYGIFRIFVSVYCIVVVIFILMTFSRGLWFVFSLSLVAFYLFDADKTHPLKHAFISCIFLSAVILVAPNFSKHFSDALLDRAQSGFQNFADKEGSFAERMELLGYSWDYAIRDNPLLGVGFKYGNLRSHTPKESTSVTIRNDPYRWLGTDSGLVYVFFRHGMIGVFLLAFFYYKFFDRGFKLYSSTKSSYCKSLMKPVLLINFVALLLSIISEPFTNPCMLIVLIISWYVLAYMYKYGMSRNR